MPTTPVTRPTDLYGGTFIDPIALGDEALGTSVALSVDATGRLVVGGSVRAEGLYLNLGEGLRFTEDNNYFSTNADARIIRAEDGNGTGGFVDGGIVFGGYTPTDDTFVEWLRLRPSEFAWQGHEIWHAGNDGSGSGLDADTWDGQQFASYLNQAVRTTDNPTFNSLTIAAGAGSLRLRGTDDGTAGTHAYLSYFNNSGSTRSGYVGYGSTGSHTFTVANEKDGDIQFLRNSLQRLMLTTAGAKVTGTLHVDSGSAVDALIANFEARNQDIRVRIGESAESAYGYHWKYLGTGGGNENRLEMWAEGVNNDGSLAVRLWDTDQLGNQSFHSPVTAQANLTTKQDLRSEGILYIGTGTNQFYDSASRIRVNAEGVSNVAQFTSYGMFLPQTGSTALYVGGAISARGGIGNDTGDLALNDTVRVSGALHSAGRVYANGGLQADNGASISFGNGTPGLTMSTKLADPGGIGYNEFHQFRVGGTARAVVFSYYDSYAALSIDTSNSRIGVGKAAPGVALDVVGNGALTGGLSTGNTITITPPQGSSSEALAFNHDYSVFVDSMGQGTDGSRIWFEAPDGGEMIFGGRAAASFLDHIRVRSRQVDFETDGGQVIFDDDVIVKGAAQARGGLTVGLNAANADAVFYGHAVPGLDWQTEGGTMSLGLHDRAWATAYVGELRAEVFTIDEQAVTTGGVHFTGFGSTLMTNETAGNSRFMFRHNAFAPGDWVWLTRARLDEATGVLGTVAELLQISTYVGHWWLTSDGDETDQDTGSERGYVYTVARAQGGTTAVGWDAGTTVFNMGSTPGYAFIEQYAVNSVLNGQAVSGPATVYHQRTGTGAFDIETRAKVGNLRGDYDYLTDAFGLAAGDAAGDWFSVDDTNGLRMMAGDEALASLQGGRLFISDRARIGGRALAVNTLEQRPVAFWNLDGPLSDSKGRYLVYNATASEATEDAYGQISIPGKLQATRSIDPVFGGSLTVDRGGSNWITDPFFETQAWAISGATLTYAEADTPIGRKTIARLTGDGTGLFYAPDTATLPASKSIIGSVLARSTSGAGVELRMYAGLSYEPLGRYDQSGTWVTELPASGEWVRVWYRYAESEYTTSGTPNPHIRATAAAAEYDVAAVQLEASPVPTSFRAGSRQAQTLKIPFKDVVNRDGDWTFGMWFKSPVSSKDLANLSAAEFETADYHYSGFLRFADSVRTDIWFIGNNGLLWRQWQGASADIGPASDETTPNSPMYIALVKEGSVGTLYFYYRERTSGAWEWVEHTLDSANTSDWLDFVEIGGYNDGYRSSFDVDEVMLLPYAAHEDVRRIGESKAPLAESAGVTRITGGQVETGVLRSANGASAIDLNDGTAHLGNELDFDGSTLRIGRNGTQESYVEVGTGEVAFKQDGLTYGLLSQNTWTLGRRGDAHLRLEPSEIGFFRDDLGTGDPNASNFWDASHLFFKASADPSIRVGQATGEHVLIDDSGLQIRNGAVKLAEVTGSTLKIGDAFDVTPSQTTVQDKLVVGEHTIIARDVNAYDNDPGKIIIGNYASGQSPHIKITGPDPGQQYVQMYYGSNTDWGIRDRHRNFQLGSHNEIAGWQFDTGRFYSGAGSAFTGLQSGTGVAFFAGATNNLGTGAKIALDADGSGHLAGGNVSWDAGGAVTIAGSITVTGGDAATKGYVQSRGENLVTNGSGLMGDLTNFSGFDVLDRAELVGGGGSFRKTSNGNSTVFSDEIIPVDVSKTYRGSMYIKSDEPTSRHYFGVICYDIDGLDVHPYHYFNNAETTLAQALNPGDTQIHLTSASGWYEGSTGHQRSIRFHPYTNQQGYTYPGTTYSRHYTSDAWAENGISGNTITLKAPWSGDTWPAGTPVVNTQSGGTYVYSFTSNTATPTEWTKIEGKLTPSQFRPGTAGVKLMWLLNRDSANAPTPVTTWVNQAELALDTVTVITDTLVSSPTVKAGAWTFGDISDDSSYDEGIYRDANNYWVDSGEHRFGSEAQYVDWNGSTLTVKGQIQATGGSFEGLLTANSLKLGRGTLATGSGNNAVGYAFDDYNGHYISQGITIWRTGTATNGARFDTNTNHFVVENNGAEVLKIGNGVAEVGSALDVKGNLNVTTGGGITIVASEGGEAAWGSLNSALSFEHATAGETLAFESRHSQGVVRNYIRAEGSLTVDLGDVNSAKFGLNDLGITLEGGTNKAVYINSRMLANGVLEITDDGTVGVARIKKGYYDDDGYTDRNRSRLEIHNTADGSEYAIQGGQGRIYNGEWQLTAGSSDGEKYLTLVNFEHNTEYDGNWNVTQQSSSSANVVRFSSNGADPIETFRDVDVTGDVAASGQIKTGDRFIIDDGTHTFQLMLNQNGDLIAIDDNNNTHVIAAKGAASS